MKTKRGYFVISNGYVRWHFLQAAHASVSNALSSCAINELDNLAVLKLDNKGVCIKSAWPNSVRCETSLASQIKRLRLDIEVISHE